MKKYWESETEFTKTEIKEWKKYSFSGKCEMCSKTIETEAVFTKIKNQFIKIVYRKVRILFYWEIKIKAEYLLIIQQIFFFYSLESKKKKIQNFLAMIPFPISVLCQT